MAMSSASEELSSSPAVLPIATILSGVLRVKLPDAKQNLIKSSWRERLCVLEEVGSNGLVQFKIYKANTIKSTSKLYQTVTLGHSSSIWKDSNPKSAIFFVREGQEGEIGCQCSSPEECDQWVLTMQSKLQDILQNNILIERNSSRTLKAEEGEASSISESVHSHQPLNPTHATTQRIVGGYTEPVRIQEARSTSSLLPTPAPSPTTPEWNGVPAATKDPPNTIKRLPSSSRPQSLDIPLFTSPIGSYHHPTEIPAQIPFWLNLELSDPNSAPLNDQGKVESHTSKSKDLSPTESTRRRLHASPVQKDSAQTSQMEISELTKVNNSLYKQIEALENDKQALSSELDNERTLHQQRVADLKTRNLLTSEECRTLREDVHRLKMELKDMRSRYEEESLKNSSDGMIQHQLETYRQLSESLTKENVKLSTDIAKLGRHISDLEISVQKSTSTIKLLLEKNASLENDQLLLQETYDQLYLKHSEITQEREHLQHSLQEISAKYKRTEIELRKLQSRVQQEILNEVHDEAEKINLLEVECSRLQKEIFTTKNERNQWEIENIRLSQELDQLKGILAEIKSTDCEHLKKKVDTLNEILSKSEQENSSLRNQLEEKEKRNALERDELATAMELSKCDAKEFKKLSKQQLQAAEGKISKMQAEILRLNTELVESERRCVIQKERVLKLEAEVAAAHDSRMLERQSHTKVLGDTQLQLENLSTTCRLYEEKNRALEQSNRSLQHSLSDCKVQLEEIEKLFQDISKSLKSEKTCNRQLQDTLEILRMEKERDALQYEEKLRRINSTSGESKQILLATETRLQEVTTQLFQDKHRRDELSLSLQSAENKCEEISSEVKKLQEMRKQDRRESESKFSQLQHALDESERVVAALRKELSEKICQIDDLTLSLKQNRWDLESQQEWRKECAILGEKLRASNERLIELEHGKNESENKYVDLFSKFENLEESMSELQSKSVNLQEAFDLSVSNCEKVGKELRLMSRKKDSLESQLLEVNQSYQDCEIRLSKKCLELKESLERTSELHLELASKTAELQSLQIEHQSLKKSMRYLEESLKSSELCVETVNFSCKTLHEEIDGLTKQCEEWKEDAQRSEKGLQQVQERLLILESENSALKKSLTDMTIQLEDEVAKRKFVLQTVEEKVSMIENLSALLAEHEGIKQEMSKELTHRSHSFHEINEKLRAAQAEVHRQEVTVGELQVIVDTLTNKLESSTMQHETAIRTYQDEIGVLQRKEFESCQKIQELDRLVETKASEISQLMDQNNQLSAKIRQQEASFEEKILNATTSLEEQLSVTYSKLTKYSQHSAATNHTIRKSLQLLSEIYKILCPLTEVGHLEASDLFSQADEPAYNDHLSEYLELSVSQVQQQTQILFDEIGRLNEILRIIWRENTVSMQHLTHLSRELPLEIREKCVHQICELESVNSPSLKDHDFDSVGVKHDLILLTAFQRSSRSISEVYLLFSNELLNSLSQLRKTLTAEFDQEMSQRDTQYTKTIRDIQESHALDLMALKNDIRSLESANTALLETIQRGELESCRIFREKEELERILRGKLSADEYQSLLGPRGVAPTPSLHPMLTSRSSDGDHDSPVPVPIFELSSIYKATPLSGSELEEKKLDDDYTTPHLLKRNRGASVSVNISRKQLFPDTPHTISSNRMSSKSRYKSIPITGVANGRIVALLGRSGESIK